MNLDFNAVSLSTRVRVLSEAAPTPATASSESSTGNLPSPGDLKLQESSVTVKLDTSISSAATAAAISQRQANETAIAQAKQDAGNQGFSGQLLQDGGTANAQEFWGNLMSYLKTTPLWPSILDTKA